MNWKTLRNNIPTHVKISRNKTYEIIWVDEFKDESVVGETRFDTNQIAIKLGQSDKETVLTVIHELLHAISDEYEVNLTETQVQLIEKSLHYFLKFVTIMLSGNSNNSRKKT